MTPPAGLHAAPSADVFGRSQAEEEAGEPVWLRTCSEVSAESRPQRCGSPGRCDAALAGGPRPPLRDRVKHLLLSLRLQKAYIGYCLLCFFLSALACASSFGRAVRLKVWEGGQLVTHSWEPWEAIAEALVGVIICAETTSTLWLMGRQEFLEDCWCLFDASVMALTLLSWSLLALRWAAPLGEGVLQFDLPLLALRFVLQPCRVLATASFARRARRMQQSTVDIAFDVLKNVESAPPTPQSRVLSTAFRIELASHIPAWCRYREWTLAYSPEEHGTSMQTFYRQQAKAGTGTPTVLAVRDIAGGVFGGFSTEPWKPCTKGFYGSGECFVFSAAPGEAARFYHVSGEHTGSVLLWGDSSSLSLAGALDLHSDFARGTSGPCPTFGSPPLSAEGVDFTVAAFECWQIGESS